MSMYECHQCGADYCNYPEYILIENRFFSKDSGNYDNKLQKRFGEITQDFAKENGISIRTASISYLRELWKRFWISVGRESLWFCSKECLMDYLGEKNE